MKTFVFHPKGIVVVDGDTIQCTALDLGLGFGKMTPTNIRINGIDAPESGTHGSHTVGPREKSCGLKVKAIVERWFQQNPDSVLFSLSWDGSADKYGRVLGDFGLINIGPMLSSYLLANKLARPYGGEKKTLWLDQELATIESFKV